MKISLKKFNTLFKDNVLDILWKQWAVLGVASNIREETNIIVDVEALLNATFILRNYEKRLFFASIEWLLKNGKLVNISRFKRIGKKFIFLKNASPPVDVIMALLQKSKSGNIPGKYRNILGNFRIRGVVSDLVIKKPSLLQLLLRGLFGINARVEIMIYLLAEKSGNSLGISKEVFYDQKIVYRILEDWLKTGIIGKNEKKNYYIVSRKEWLRLLNIQKMSGYINWGNVFAIFTQIIGSLSAESKTNNKYIASSLFRDVYERIKPLAESLKIKLPEPDLYKGEEYFTPFAEVLLKISEKL